MRTDRQTDDFSALYSRLAGVPALLYRFPKYAYILTTAIASVPALSCMQVPQICLYLTTAITMSTNKFLMYLAIPSLLHIPTMCT